MPAKLFNIFYGTSARLIARWCRVTLNTAYQWKRADRVPGPQARELFLLHRHGRVLGDEWEGWMVRGNLLIDPEGNETTQGQLRAYFYVYQLARELSRGNDEKRAQLDALLRLATGETAPTSRFAVTVQKSRGAISDASRTG